MGNGECIVVNGAEQSKNEKSSFIETALLQDLIYRVIFPHYVERHLKVNN